MSGIVDMVSDQDAPGRETITDEEYAARVMEQVLPGRKCEVRQATGHERSHDIDLYRLKVVEARVEVVRLTDPEAEKASKKPPNWAPHGSYSTTANISSQVQERIDNKAERNQATDHDEPKWLVVVILSPGGMDVMVSLGQRQPWESKTEGDQATLAQFDGIDCRIFDEVWIVWEQVDHDGQETAVARFPQATLCRYPPRWCVPRT